MKQLIKMAKKLGRRAFEQLFPKLYLKTWLSERMGRDPEADLIPYLCDHEHISIDVGSHYGLYIPELLQHSKLTYAFEINPRLSRFISRAYHSSRLIVETVGLSDHNGSCLCRIPEELPGLATIEKENALGPEEVPHSMKIKVVKVQTKLLDDYDLSGVGFIKIDVEGHEFAVLKGAERTLARDRPSLVIEIKEIHKPNEWDDINQFLGRLNYRGFFLSDKVLHPIESFVDHRIVQSPDITRQMVLYLGGNFIFIHNNHLNRVSALLAP